MRLAGLSALAGHAFINKSRSEQRNFERDLQCVRANGFLHGDTYFDGSSSFR